VTLTEFKSHLKFVFLASYSDGEIRFCRANRRGFAAAFRAPVPLAAGCICMEVAAGDGDTSLETMDAPMALTSCTSIKGRSGDDSSCACCDEQGLCDTFNGLCRKRTGRLSLNSQLKTKNVLKKSPKTRPSRFLFLPL
jgi:hypothetical protein